MLAKILKQFCDSYLLIITKIISENFTEGTLPSELKLVEVIPVFLNIGLYEQGELQTG